MRLAVPCLSALRRSTVLKSATVTLVTLLGLTGCSHNFSGTPQAITGQSISGAVHGGQQPVAGALIQLYAVGATGDGSPAAKLLTVTVTTSDGTGNTTNANANAGNNFNRSPIGSFGITGDYTCPSSGAQVYLTATGGNPGLGSGVNNALAMMDFLGNCGNLSSTTSLQVNELTTVGSIAPLYPFMKSFATVGSGTGDALQLSEAAAEVTEYTNLATGSVPGPTLPAGYYASSAELTTLADIVAGCINSAGGVAGDNSTCGQLFTLATPPSGTAPTDTVAAIVNILTYPNQNVTGIFGLLLPASPYQPALVNAPPSWSLPILPIAATPAISPATGSYMGPQTVTITDASSKAAIYYTTDGSNPTTASTLYTGSFVANASETINAIAAGTGYKASSVGSSSLTITLAGVASKLAFLVQPSTVAYGVAIAPSVQVAVEDANSNIVTTGSSTITLALSSNPGNATVGGTVSQATVNGIATFPGLTLSAVGSGYQFAAFGGGFFALSNTFNVTLYPITVTPADPLLGVGSTLPGSFTLTQPAPAGGITVSLSSSSTTNLTVSPATVTVAAGATTGTYTYTGVAIGPASITAAATGYLTSSSTVTVTNSFISMGTLPTLAIGSTANISLSLGAVAPTGGLTVTFTSSNPNVATVSSSVFVPAGVKIAAQVPTLVGIGPGTTTITASAPNFAPDIRSITLTLVLSLPATINVPLSPGTASATVTLAAPAPAGGLTITLSTDKPSIATVPASIFIPTGALTGTATVTAVTQGTTTLRADYPGATEATSTVNVQGTLYANTYAATGAGLTSTNDYFYLSSAPSSPVTVTVTSSNPAVATIGSGSSATAAGTASVTFPNILTSSSVQYFNVQGISPGTTTITIAATGYTTVTSTVTVYPSSLVLGSSGGSLVTGSSASVNVVTAYLNPTTLAVIGTSLPVNPGSGPYSIAVTSSNTAVATLSGSPATITAGQYSTTLTLKALTAGTAVVALGAEPTGLSTTTSTIYNQGTYTVTSPVIYTSNTTLLGVGLNSGTTNYSYVYNSPTSASMTITSSAPGVVSLVAGSGTTTNSNGSLSCPIPANSFVYCYYTLQGLALGTSTITSSATGYTSATSTVTVDPAAIAFNTSSFSTQVGNTINVYATTEVLNPTTLAVLSTGLPVNNPVSIPITSGTPSVGTVSSGTLTFPAGNASGTVTFNPLAPGTSIVTLGAQPAGFTTPPAASTTATVTVTAPNISYYGSSATGVGLSSSGYNNYAYLATAPASPVTLTVTSSSPAVATLGVGNTPTAAGTASITFSNVTGSYNYQYFNIQGQTAGTSTITISAPGYTSSTYVVTVYPSALVLSSIYGTTTTTFSTPTQLTVTTAILSNGSVYGTGYSLNPGTGPLTIAVTSATPAVGVITASPVTIMAGASSATTTFKPLTAGTSVVSLGSQPIGFSAPPVSSSQTTFTVTAPAITTSGSVTLGTGLNNGTTTGSYYSGGSYAYLSVAPLTPASLTVTSSNPAVAVISPGQTATVTGTGTLTFTNITSTAYQYFNLQGLSVGTSTISIASTGYATSTFTVTVDPSGFALTSGSFSTTTYATPTTITVATVALSPGTLTVVSTGLALNPGTGNLSLAVTSGTPTVGTISSSPVTFTAGQGTATTTFSPLAIGSSSIALGTQPAGFSTPSVATSVYLTATVTAPQIYTSTPYSVSVGSYGSGYFELYVTPPSPVNVTITSSNPAVATVGSTSTNGSGTVIFSNVSNTNYTSYYVQGVSTGTATITISAPGYQTVTSSVSIQ